MSILNLSELNQGRIYEVRESEENMASAKCDLKMKSVNPIILQHGFKKAPPEWGEGKTQWYEITIPQTFRGTYTLYLCDGDICGVFQGQSVKGLDFDSFMDKLSFRTPEAVEWTKNLLYGLQKKGIIDFDLISWEVKE
jgi:hypothetical protein